MDILLKLTHLIQFNILKLLWVLRLSLTSIPFFIVLFVLILILLSWMPFSTKSICIMLNLFLCVVNRKTAICVIYHFIQTSLLLLLIWFALFYSLNEIKITLVLFTRFYIISVVICFYWSSMWSLTSDSLLPLSHYSLQYFDFFLLLNYFVYNIDFITRIRHFVIVEIWLFLFMLVFQIVFKYTKTRSISNYLGFIVLLDLDSFDRMDHLLVLGILNDL